MSAMANDEIINKLAVVLLVKLYDSVCTDREIYLVAAVSIIVAISD